MSPWSPTYPYLYYEEAPFTIRRHSVWHDLDYLTRRVAVLEQKVSDLEKAHTSKDDKDAVSSS